MERLKRQAEEARRQADRLDKMLALATELGDEGLSELVALLSDSQTAAQPANGTAVHVVSDGPTLGRNRYTAETPGIPRGRDAVRRIVSERPGIWTLSEIREEMRVRGWLISPKGVEAAAKRLCDLDGEGKHIGPGRYVFPANFGEEEEAETTVPAKGEPLRDSVLSLVTEA